MFWPFVRLVLRNLYLCALLIFNCIVWSCFGLVFLLLSCLHSLYILHINLCQIDGFQILSPILWIGFSVCWFFLLLCRRFSVWCSGTYLFLLLLSRLLLQYLKNYCPDQCHGDFPLSFRNFMVSVPKFKPLIKLIWLSWFHVWYKIRIHLYFHLLIFCFSNTVYLRRRAYLKEVATISVCTWWQGLESSVPTSCWCHSSSCW